MKCYICKKNQDAGALYRINPKGKKGLWACKAHRPKRPPYGDPTWHELDKIMDAFK